MKRDSTTTSIWQDTVPACKDAPSGSGPASYDVVIAGAGITGLTLGLILREAGKRCLILEANAIGFGTTSGTSAHLNTVLDTPYPDIISKFGEDNARLVADAAHGAIGIIDAHINRYNIDCDFRYCSGFMLAETEQEEQELEAMYKALEKVGIPVNYASDSPVPLPFRKSIEFKGQARFHPLRYLAGLANAFLAAGGVIKEGFLAEKTERKGDALHVYAGNETFTCQQMVYATHIPPGINLLHFRCAPYRSYVIGVELEDESLYPEDLAYDMKDPYHYFRTAAIDGKRTLLVGGCDHKTGHHDNTTHLFAELEAYVRGIYPVRSVTYKWSAQYYEPADGLPYIGHLPGSDDQVFAATGYSGNGMIFGTLSGQIIADLILQKESPYAGLFAPSRIKPVAGFSNFVRENADVVRHFVADRLSTEALDSFADLGKEEGRVVKYQERQVAIYKDEKGKITALHPVCPHAGCIVQWNRAEKSWDCPCHGARYSTEGTLLTGPSTSGLKKIDVD